MKTCSYCGRENEDAVNVCVECGTGMTSAPPVVDPQLSDPARALVIVRTFGTMELASLLAARLEAAGIEACIPESGTQPFSNVFPLDYFTVRVAAKDRDAAEGIAVEMAKAMDVSTGADLSNFWRGTFRFLVSQNRPLLARNAMMIISVVILAVPIVFGIAVHSERETAAMGPLFWLWVLFSAACLFWGRYAFRRYRVLAYVWLAIGMLQVISFSCLFWTVDLAANAQSQPDGAVHNNNSHNW